MTATLHLGQLLPEKPVRIETVGRHVSTLLMSFGIIITFRGVPNRCIRAALVTPPLESFPHHPNLIPHFSQRLRQYLILSSNLQPSLSTSIVIISPRYRVRSIIFPGKYLRCLLLTCQASFVLRRFLSDCAIECSPFTRALHAFRLFFTCFYSRHPFSNTFSYFLGLVTLI
jgi:hypothetical protein